MNALRHGMAGQPGWELFGPWDDYDAVHEALVAAGERLRDAARRRARLLVEHARVRLDPLPVARRVLRRLA